MLYSLWMTGKSISAPVSQQVLGKGYPVFSWYSIMAGVGIFPDARDLRPPTAKEARYNMAEIDNLLDRSVVNYPDHRRLLTKIPPRPVDESLQIYFW
jgi:tryptophan 6-halogenase